MTGVTTKTAKQISMKCADSRLELELFMECSPSLGRRKRSDAQDGPCKEFSVADPIRLIRKIHGLNPKTRTRFELMIVGVGCLRIKGDDLSPLAELLQTHGPNIVCLRLATCRQVRVSGQNRRWKVVLPSERTWGTYSLASYLPFLCPGSVEWQVAVQFPETEAARFSFWISTEDLRQLLEKDLRIARHVLALRHPNIKGPVPLS